MIVASPNRPFGGANGPFGVALWLFWGEGGLLGPKSKINKSYSPKEIPKTPRQLASKVPSEVAGGQNRGCDFLGGKCLAERGQR